ncbi:hypothetical protein K426_20330 [Sphingobium sp. TKS]|nr:hypothetical protein K426_20330 [Sphingobium sp. TKS]
MERSEIIERRAALRAIVIESGPVSPNLAAGHGLRADKNHFPPCPGGDPMHKACQLPRGSWIYPAINHAAARIV